MKTFTFIMVFLSSSALLFAQNRADTTMFIEPTSGGSAADRTFFDENLKMEIEAAGYNVIDDILDAIYSIGGTIAPEDDGHVLSISLSNAKEGREMVAQELFYIRVEESYEVLPFLVWQMLANAPFLESEPPPPLPPVVTDSSGGSRMTPIVNLINAVPDDESWKNKWIYVGAKFGPSLHFYISSSDGYGNDDKTPTNNPFFTVAAGLDVSVQVLDFLAVQTELGFGLDNGDYRGLNVGGTPPPVPPVDPVDRVYKATYLSVPLLVKGMIKPGRIFLLEPYGGAALNISLTPRREYMVLPLAGWLAGVSFGFKVGSGILFIDLRYAMDFSDTTVFDELVQFKRHTATIAGGYKIGFLNRKQSATRYRGARY
jgi:hypothetical protein